MFQECQERGYQSLLFLAQAQARKTLDGDLRIIALSRDMDMTFWLPQAEAVLAQVGGC